MGLDEIPKLINDDKIRGGIVYLVYGSDQQIKLELLRRGIPYEALIHPSYEEVERVFATESNDLFEDQLRATIIIPKSYKLIDDNPRTGKKGKWSIPNYTNIRIAQSHIFFVIGDPYEETKELKSFYDGLKGGIFYELKLPEPRFPLTELRHSEITLENPDLFTRLMKDLLANRVDSWRSLNRNQFYRFLGTPNKCPLINSLYWHPTYKCRDLIPWLNPFITQLRKERWQHPGDKLGLFARWVQRASTIWAEDFSKGLFWMTFRGKDILLFNPSQQAIENYPKYLRQKVKNKQTTN